MKPIVSERKGFFPEHGIQRQIGIEMGEEITAAGRFPFQRSTEDRGVDCDQKEIGLTSKMKFRSLDRLGGRGEMDVTVLEIDRSTPEKASRSGLLP